MKLMQKSICALAVLAATATSFTAQAASVDLKVIGTITPPACVPTLTGGGVVDYGTISTGILSATDYTVLPAKTSSLSVSCDAPAKMSLYIVNKRPNTLAGATENAGTQVGAAPVTFTALPNTYAVGLGLSGTQKIGGFGISFNQNVTIDGQQGVTLRRSYDSSNTGVWTAPGSANGVIVLRNSGLIPYEMTWGIAGTTVPVAFEKLEVPVNVQAYINKRSELTVNGNIPLDGLLTFEMVYL